MKQQTKIVVVGSGQIGGTVALLGCLKSLGDIYLYDVVENIAAGKALDLGHFNAIEGLASKIGCSTDAPIFNNADVVVVTAGLPRKPGMLRDDLLTINGKIMCNVGELIKVNCPDAFVICTTNPLDAMVQILQQESGLPTSKVIGMAGVLDSARFKYHLSMRLNVSPDSIKTCVMGSHGDTMVFLPRYTSVEGIPLQECIHSGWLKQEDLDQIVEKTRYGGQEIVHLLKSGSAFFGPAGAVVEMAESYLKNQKKVLCCSAYLNGQYGTQNVYAGVPVVIGANGLEKIIELELNSTELEAFKHSAGQIKALVQTFYQT